MSREIMEPDEDSWTRFISTGRVEDYLKYRNEIRNSTVDTGIVGKEREDGRNSYIYGDDTDGITYEGVR